MSKAAAHCRCVRRTRQGVILVLDNHVVRCRDGMFLERPGAPSVLMSASRVQTHRHVLSAMGGGGVNEGGQCLSRQNGGRAERMNCCVR